MRSRSSLVLLALVPLTAVAQGPASVLESYTTARTIVDRAVAAHGGTESLSRARHVRVLVEGHDYHRFQSRRVAPPYDSTVYRSEMLIDLERGVLVADGVFGYPGGFYYSAHFVTDSARAYRIDRRNRSFRPAQYPPASQQTGNLYSLPPFLVQAAAGGSTLRWIGRMTVPSGAPVDVVGFMAQGQFTTLGFDPVTHQLRAVMGVGYDPMAGLSEAVTEFLDYRDAHGVFMPAQAVTWRGGEVTRRQRFVATTPNYAVPDSMLSPPASFAELPAPVPAGADSVRQLAPGVWALRAGGSFVLAVAFRDHVIVVDAPPVGAPALIARLAQVAPGKPVRYVVPTHHHDDHFFGARNFAAAGATVVTTPGNRGYFERAMAAPASPLMAGAVPPQPSARLEILTNRRRVFSDGTQTLEVHDVGPNDHAEEMLVAWLPREGVLFQADLIEAPSGVATRGSNATATMQLADYIRRQKWNVRAFVGAHGTLNAPEIFGELTRLPIVPPE